MNAGDLVFCHSSGIIGRAIRLGEWIRFRRGSFYNHVAMLYKQTPDGDWLVIQAEAHGVTNTGLLSTIAPGGSYVVCANPASSVPRAGGFMAQQVGAKYGFLTIASLIVTILTPVFFSFRMPNTWICSAVSAESLRVGGWVRNWADVYQVTPSQLWSELNPASPPLATVAKATHQAAMARAAGRP